MTIPSWQLKTSVSAIVFDCDGTLTSIEGIDFLAKNNGVADKIEPLTLRATEISGLTPSLYQQRLDLVLPRREQVYALGHQYFMHKAPDIIEIIHLLLRLNKTLYLVSSGVNPAVRIFGEMLQIPAKNVYAVDLRFDQQGNFLHCENDSPLIHHDGKKKIVQELKNKHGQIVHIGDGLNDIMTRDLVTRFIGYGGVTYRKKIADLCQFYINTLSFAPLLPLVLTQEEFEILHHDEKMIYQKGLLAIQEGKIQIPNQDNQTASVTQSLQFD